MSATPHSPQLTAPQAITVASPIGAAQSNQDGLGFADILRVLKQRRLSIIIIFMLMFSGFVALTFAVARFAPAYSSRALIQVEPPRQTEGFTPRDPIVNSQYLERVVQTEASKIKSQQVLLDVVEQPEIKATEYYQWYGNDVALVADGLRQDLSVGAVRDQDLIRVAIATRNRSEAKLIVDTLVDLYLQRFRDAEDLEIRGQLADLRETQQELQQKLTEKRTEINTLRATTQVPMIDMRRIEARRDLQAIREQQMQLDAAAASLQAQLNNLSGNNPDQLPLTAEHRLIIESDPILRFWRSQVETLDIELEAARNLFGENHRRMKVLKDRRTENLAKETARREELIDQVRQRQIETLRQELAQTRAVQQRFQEQVRQMEAEERDIDRGAQALEQLEEDKQLLLDQIALVEQRITETQHRIRDDSRVGINVIERPVEATEPSRPSFPMYLGGGFVLSLATALGFAFLREFTDQGIRTPIDVARFGSLSVLGCIPMLDDEEDDRVETIEEAVRKAPDSLVAEAFRRVRASLQYSGPSESQKSLLVTSPGPEDGKTAIAVNLATTLAHGNLRVLLIDCNFRRPAIRSLFENTKAEGLCQILVGDGGLRDYVTPTDLPNLDVLSSGPMPPTPAELFGSEQMKALLAEAREQYDRVVLDGPPTLLMSDAGVLASQVDNVIVVARAEANTRGVVKRTRVSLEEVGAHVVGAVLNAVRAKPGGYFRQQYREFYDYRSEETIAAELPPPRKRDDSSDEA